MEELLMKRTIYHWLVSVFATLVITVPLHAQEIDEEWLNELVQKEVERLLNVDGVLDTAIDRGIERFVQKQRQDAEQARTNQQQEKVKNMRPVDINRDHIFGNPDALVTLVEYSDFECPFCKRFHPTVVKLMENNLDNLRWVYRHFPLDFHNPGAQKQAEASECVAEINGNEAFWKFADFIYQRTKSNGKGLPLDNLRPLAEEVGVDGETFSECMDSGKMAARVKEDIDNGVRIGVTGTPAAVFTNQKGEVRIIAGAYPLEDLQALVDELSR
jgi:protein-disulfide isomerase